MQVPEKQVWDSVTYIVFELVIAVLAVLGNVLVCWAVYLNSNLQNITNFFVVSLAVADIAVGVLAIPFAVTVSTGFCSLFYGCLFLACFVVVLTQSSIFSLLAIAVDRYICIKIPLRYNSLVTGARARGVICICWLLSFLIGLTPLLGWNKSSGNGTLAANGTRRCGDGMVTCLFEEVVTMDYMVYYNFFACVLLPLLLMLGIYTRIFMAARHQLKQMDVSRSTLQKEVQAAKSLAIIVGLFAACWLPLHIINCVNLFCENCRPPASVMYFAIILSHANSVVNPLIYAYRIREFRQTFRKILKRHILRRTEQTFTRQNTRSSIHIGGGSVNLHINGCGLDRLNAAAGEEGGAPEKDRHLLHLRPNCTGQGDPQNERVLCQGQHLPEEQDLYFHTAFSHQAACSPLAEAS
ncbi:adenosine A2a receptor a isoform X1 [Pristis pectinata]|uniref:adenosine A2a receptor a isoform X1 n=1 Tax=Pristis pectinata TaxID=685728 RepID=UPI00223E85B3|nr:adenosine A2a receptor a isoform X1 [Pristis pectinata]XP_051888025.1 adenosine A2a receptor a isoform X1 [Pristis pectinata]XP_051888026.1 adenosine A2a receptor a isoform X1 [Pristis pectinata]XP_051888027.1 adenosine A2a receptor a isoform X1 [Pristis pectinata]XP_051888028.1 adenosine A2a receptor a isoform X1 [Pristis pectinata]